MIGKPKKLSELSNNSTIGKLSAKSNSNDKTTNFC